MKRNWLAGMLAIGLALGTVGTAPPVLAAPPALGLNAIADLVERAAPAVVNIDTITRQRVRVSPIFGPSQTRVQERRGLGSGFILRADGLIVTNNHVVAGASEVLVTLNDGRQFEAKVIGRDAPYDLAVLKIDARGLPKLDWADFHKVRVGEWVVAMGSPLGLDKTVTQGIVSALNRNVAVVESVPFIQTDAAINPGNSGGPLLDLDGRVVGVTTAVAAGAQGIGFAIPADLAKEAVTELVTRGRIRRPWLGIGISPITPERAKQAGLPAGLYVMEIYAQTGAAMADLRPGDVIVAIGGKPVRSLFEMRQVMQQHSPGDRVTLTVVRDGRQRSVTVQLSELPAEAQTR